MSQPWYNTCVLFANTVLDQLQTQKQGGPRFELLRDLAQSVATFHLDDRQDGYPKAMNQILQDGLIHGGRNYERNYKSQVMTKYKLLERLATALGCASQDMPPSPRVQFTEVIHDRLKPILQDTSRWHQIGRDMQNHLSGMSIDQHDLFMGPVPDTLQPHEQSFCRNLGWLWGAHRSFLKSDVAIAEGNLQLMAFMLQWHATNDIPFPAKAKGFLDAVTRCPAIDGFPTLSGPALSALQGEDGSALFEGLKAAVDLSVHISPLTLLTPVAFKRWSMDRERLFDWTDRLGPKPSYIRVAEDKLWDAIISIALGTSCRDALRSFLDHAGECMDACAAEATLVRTFFMNGYVKNEDLPERATAHVENTPIDLNLQDAVAGSSGEASAGPANPSAVAEEDTSVPPIDSPVTALAASPSQHSTEPVETGNGATSEERGAAADLLPHEDPPSPMQGDAVLGNVKGTLPSNTLVDFGSAAVQPLWASLQKEAHPPRSTNEAVSPMAQDDPLSELTESDDEESDSLDVVGAEPKGKNASELNADEHRRTTGRQLKPVAPFTSGVLLTAGPPAKKRLRVREGSSGQQDPPVKVKEEERWWESTEAYWSKAYAEAKNFALGESDIFHDDREVTPGSPVQDIQEIPKSKKSVQILLFDGNPSTPAIPYTFQPDANSGLLDVPLVQQIWNNVQVKFGEAGIPPHRLPSSSSFEFHDNSKIFVVDNEVFQMMQPELIQRIFNDRHILVHNVEPRKPVEFDEEGLSMLAPLDDEVYVQHANQKTDDNSESMLQLGTLQSLLDHVRSKSTVAHNVLDLPMGKSPVPEPTMFQHIATDAHSGPYVKALTKPKDLRNTTKWGTGSTEGALSWAHVDDYGFGTYVGVQAGGKWWVLAERLQQDRHRDEMGDISVFNGWRVRNIDPKLWTLEAVYLQPGSVLYMRPCTPHFVLGTEPSIVFGRHFYAASTIRRSAFGVLHTFVMGFVVTNTTHGDETKALFRQIMAFWYRHYIICDRFGVDDAHVPDILTQDGLLDVIAVGCILEFASALNRELYAGNYDEDSDEAISMNVEAAHARSRFRVIMKTFATRYVTLINKQMVHPSYIWNRILVQFGAAMVTYLKRKWAVLVKFPGVTPQSVAAAVKTHLQRDHPHLVVPFERELKLKPKPTALTWTGSAIEIVPRSAHFDNVMSAVGIEEWREMPEHPIYLGGDDSYYQGEWSSDSSEDGN